MGVYAFGGGSIVSQEELIYAIRGFYNKPGNENGGVLRIALDDGNMRDENLNFCMKEAETARDVHAFYLAEELMRLTYRTRLDIFKYGYYVYSIARGKK